MPPYREGVKSGTKNGRFLTKFIRSEMEQQKAASDKTIAVLTGYAICIDALILYSALQSFIATASIYDLSVVIIFSLLLAYSTVGVYKFIRQSKSKNGKEVEE